MQMLQDISFPADASDSTEDNITTTTGTVTLPEKSKDRANPVTPSPNKEVQSLLKSPSADDDESCGNRKVRICTHCFGLTEHVPHEFRFLSVITADYSFNASIVTNKEATEVVWTQDAWESQILHCPQQRIFHWHLASNPPQHPYKVHPVQEGVCYRQDQEPWQVKVLPRNRYKGGIRLQFCNQWRPWDTLRWCLVCSVLV